MNYQFKINDFEGPLDLLLHLIKENKMDIAELKVTIIVEEYLNFIHSMTDLNIDIASEYLVMASELVHLKSRILLNDTDEDDEDFELNTEEDLKNKLLEYQKYKNITSSFKELEEKRSEVYTKLPENLSEYRDNISYDNNESIDLLFAAFNAFLERQKFVKPLNTRITRKEYSIEDRIKSIRNIINKNKKTNFYDLFDMKTKDYFIITFLSILEMTKNKEIVINQSNNFGDIYLETK